MDNKLNLVSVLIKPEQLNKLKLVLKTLKSEFKELHISAPKMGKIGKELLISFKITTEYQTKIVKALTENDIKILSLKDRAEILKQIREERESAEETAKEKEIEDVRKGWGDLLQEVSDKPHTPITQLINEGNYSEILKIARDFRVNDKYKKEALNGVGSALNILLARIYRNGMIEEDPYPQIAALLKIGADQNLKMIHEEKLMIDACIKAIELASENEESFVYLIQICNNSNIHPLGTIEAILKFSEIVFSNSEKYFYLIELAVKDLNLRWLNIALDARPRKFPQKKLDAINKLIGLIQARRDSKGFEF